MALGRIRKTVAYGRDVMDVPDRGACNRIAVKSGSHQQ
jgi:hypothetical protein